jgi:hypothetical protein
MFMRPLSTAALHTTRLLGAWLLLALLLLLLLLLA